MTKIAIIGAGLSPLSIAHLLKDQARITLFDKARGVSGRMSTRRASPYCFDHGAQYFTARTAAFQTFIQPLIRSRLIDRWNARYVKFDGEKIIERKDWRNDEPRYVGVPGMNAVAKHLADGLTIHLKTKIASLQRNLDEKWQLLDESGSVHGDFDWVISTAPSPQAAELLPTTFQYHDYMRGIEMRPCFSLMLGFSEPLPIEFDAAHVTNADVSWMAVNSSKPGRPHPFALLVHSSEPYAEAHLGVDRGVITKHLCAETSRIIGLDVAAADFKAVHGWHYANNAKRESHQVLLDRDNKLAACGDWCQGGRVEGAFTSAVNLVEMMRENLL
jgi:predicted NAD/FAD-dependent oxidoreductase